MLRLPPDQRLFAPQRVEIARVHHGRRRTLDAERRRRRAPRRRQLHERLLRCRHGLGRQRRVRRASLAGARASAGRPRGKRRRCGGGPAQPCAGREPDAAEPGSGSSIYQFAMRDLRRATLAGGAAAVGRASYRRTSSAVRCGRDRDRRYDRPDVAACQTRRRRLMPRAVGMTRVAVDRVLRGQFAGRELVAGFLVMRNRTLLPAARYGPRRPRPPAARAVQPRGARDPRPAAVRRYRGRGPADVLGP